MPTSGSPTVRQIWPVVYVELLSLPKAYLCATLGVKSVQLGFRLDPENGVFQNWTYTSMLRGALGAALVFLTFGTP